MAKITQWGGSEGWLKKKKAPVQCHDGALIGSTLVAGTLFDG